MWSRKKLCDKETLLNANPLLTLLNRLMIIEEQLQDGLSKSNQQNEGLLISNAKSNNL